MSITQKRHKNSKLVYLKRLPLVIHESNKDLEEDYYAHASRSIGSFFAKSSVRPGTGLSITEENFLLPYILNIPMEDRDFRKEVANHYYDIDTKVLSGEGTALEIGLNDGGEHDEVSKDNLPINIAHFLKFRHALAHPEVAVSLDEGKGNSLKAYYINDPEAVTEGAIKVSDLQDAAFEAYLTIKKSVEKVKMYLTLLGKFSTNLKDDELILKLRVEADKRPKQFLAVHKDKDKEFSYFLDQAVIKKALKLVGTRYLITESAEEIGRDKAQAIQWLKDSKNSKSVVVLKALVQGSVKAKTKETTTGEPPEGTEGAEGAEGDK